MVKKVPVWLLQCLIVFSVPLSSRGEPEKAVNAYRVGRAPAIDGKLTETCWRKADVATGFVSEGTSSPESARTLARVCYDEYNLYFGFELHTGEDLDEILEDMKQQYGTRDTDIADEAIEIFLDVNHDRASYYHFQLCMVTDTDAECTGGMASWNPAWNIDRELASSMDSANHVYYIEVRIPFAGLGIGKDVTSVWGVDFWRYARDGGGLWSGAAHTHRPQDFGLLKGLDVDFTKFLLASSDLDLRVYLAEDGGRQSAVSCLLDNLTGSTQSLLGKAVLKSPSGEEWAVSREVIIHEGERRPVEFLCDIVEAGKYDVHLKFCDLDGGGELHSTWRELEFEESALRLAYRNPAYRRCLYATQEDKTIAVDVGIHAAPALLGRLTLSGAVKDKETGKIVAAGDARITGNTVSLRLDASEIPPAEYALEFTLKQDDEVLDAAAEDITRLASAGDEVYLGADGTVMVNGTPLFPIELLSVEHDTPPALEEAIRAGFTSGPYGFLPTKPEIRDVLREYGYRPCPTHFSKGYIEQHREEPMILYWYQFEELDIGSEGPPDKYVATYRDICGHDPYHPVAGLVFNAGMFNTIYGDMQDIFITEPYLYPEYGMENDVAAMNHMIEQFVMNVDTATAAARGKTRRSQSARAYIAVMQGWDGRAWQQRWGMKKGGEIDPARIPSLLETRLCSYLAILHGANGIGWYASVLDYWHYKMNPLFWEAQRGLVQELKCLSPVFLSKEDLTEEMEYNEADGMDCLLKRYAGDLYLIAANRRYTENKARIAFGRLTVPKQMRVISEARQVALKDGILEDRFDPFAVHVYTTGSTTPNLLLSRMLADPYYRAIPSKDLNPGNLAAEFNGALATSSFRHWNVNHVMFANDGDPRTCWTSSRWLAQRYGKEKADSEDWIEIEFAEPANVARIVVKTWVPRYFPEDNARPYVKDTLSEYDLRYLKGDTWVRLVSVEGNDKEVREHTFEAIRTDKIRLTSRRGLCVAEIEAYGPAR